MNLPKPLATVDSDMVKFLTTLGPGKIRHLFAPEVIDYSEINSYLELKGKKKIPQPSTEKEVIVDIGIQFVREEISANLIKFTLGHGLFGNLGVLWLSSADVYCTDFDIEEPLFPTREEAKLYSRLLLDTKPSLFNFTGDGPVPMDAILVTLPANSLHQRRINLQQAIVDAFQVVVMGSSGEVKTVNDENLIRVFFVRLAFADAKDEVESFLWHQQSRLTFSRTTIEIPEGYAYDIRHNELGDLGQFSLHPREGNRTRVRITKPLPQPAGENRPRVDIIACFQTQAAGAQLMM